MAGPLYAVFSMTAIGGRPLALGLPPHPPGVREVCAAMIRWILGSTLRLAPVMVAAAAVLLFLGVSQTRQAPVDALPEFGPAQVQVQTEALGLSATEVGPFITRPLEDEPNGSAH